LFGDYLRNLRRTELKAKELLKRKRFRSAQRPLEIPEAELTSLAKSALTKGMIAAGLGESHSAATQRELVAYSRRVLRFVDEVLDVAAQHNVQVIATVVDAHAPRPEGNKLRKDHIYLLERYFYLLEELPPRERGLVIFDELEKTRAKILIQQLASYFLGHPTGKDRSARIVPEPFFVHSELTTGVFLADLTAYVLGWGWRSRRMQQPDRPELRAYAAKLHEMQYRGQKPRPDGSGAWSLYGITYLDDLRSRLNRETEEEC
jgi:hypothetical protein